MDEDVLVRLDPSGLLRQGTDHALIEAASGECRSASGKSVQRRRNPQKGAGKKKGSSRGAKTAKTVAAKDSVKSAKKENKPSSPRSESKATKFLEMIGRANGATLAEIMNATDWQAHSVRGFISTAGKKHGISIVSFKNEAGDRVYQITK